MKMYIDGTIVVKDFWESLPDYIIGVLFILAFVIGVYYLFKRYDNLEDG